MEAEARGEAFNEPPPTSGEGEAGVGQLMLAEQFKKKRYDDGFDRKAMLRKSRMLALTGRGWNEPTGI